MPADKVAAAVFAAVRHLARRRIEDEVIVLDLRRSRIYGMNPSAGEVLDALQIPSTLEAVASRFDGAAGEAISKVPELARFIAELAALGLVERRVNPAGDAEVAPAAAGSMPWAPPALLWQEEVVRVTSQISPPQQIGNPACLP